MVFFCTENYENADSSASRYAAFMALYGFPLTHSNDVDLTGGIPAPNPPKSILGTEPLNDITLATLDDAHTHVYLH